MDLQRRRVPRIMSGVNHLPLLGLLLVPALASLSPAAESPAPSVQAEPAEQAALPVRLRSLLDGMERAQSEDFVPAALMVLAESGDPSSFLPLMEEA